MTAPDPASDAELKHGVAVSDTARDSPPNYSDKSDLSTDSKEMSTDELKPHFNTAANDASKPLSESNSDIADEKSSPPKDQPEQVRQITGIRWFLVVFAILSSTFLFALDNTVVADVQPKIVDRFGQIQKLPWLSVSFLVAAVATNLIW